MRRTSHNRLNQGWKTHGPQRVFLWPGQYIAFEFDTHGLDDSLRWRAVRRLKASQSQAEVARWLQVTCKWFPDHGINSKQVVLSPGRSIKVTPEHRHLHRIATWH
ncbi:hypothetical protein TNCV_3576971 [Trichonephila clavipes]|uniref:Transposase n=1 Tax=Trichonephila clavipes TaxID=2585209 RepID=A0A8X6RFZ8_TRICX|nr:hypothetical protein TNCV_3576971 [Trichonephila clavipes]